MSLEPAAAVPGNPATEVATSPVKPLPFAVVSVDVTPIMPPGYTQTQTTKADGVITTVVTNASGGMVDTTFSTSTAETSESAVSVWA